MRRRSIQVAGLAHGTNPIPAASRVGPLLVTGAVRGVDRSTGVLPPDPGREVELAFQNLAVVIEAGGGDLDDVAHVTVFLGADGLRDVVNHHWVLMFPQDSSRPARHVIRHELPGGMRVQLEAMAYVIEDRSGGGRP